MELTEQQQQALWDELAREREGTPPAEKPLETNADQANAEATNNDVNAEAPAEAKTDDVAAEQANTEEQKPDPLHEVLAKLEGIEKRQRNVEGHIGNLNRNQHQLQEMLAASKAASSKVDDSPTQTQVQEAMKDPEEWEKLKGDFPEWAEATEKFFDARMSKYKAPQPSIDQQQVEQIVQQRVANQTAQIREEMISSTLELVLPDWEQEVNTPEFDNWLKAQPAEVQALEKSSKIADAAKMLRLFSESKTANPNAEIIAARQRNLENATAAPKGVKPPRAKTVDEMSPEELWNYEAKLREKRRRGY